MQNAYTSYRKGHILWNPQCGWTSGRAKQHDASDGENEKVTWIYVLCHGNKKIPKYPLSRPMEGKYNKIISP